MWDAAFFVRHRSSLVPLFFFCCLGTHFLHLLSSLFFSFSVSLSLTSQAFVLSPRKLELPCFNLKVMLPPPFSSFLFKT